MNITYTAWKKSLGNICTKKLFSPLVFWGILQAGIVTVFLHLMEIKNLHVSLIVGLFVLMLILYSAVNIPLHEAVKSYFSDTKIEYSGTLLRRFVTFSMSIYALCFLPIILYGIGFFVYFFLLGNDNFIISTDKSFELNFSLFMAIIGSFLVFELISLYLFLKFLFSSAYFFEYYKTKTNKELLKESWKFSKGKLGNMFFTTISLGFLYSFVGFVLSFGNMETVAYFLFSGIYSVFFFVLYSVMKQEQKNRKIKH